MSVFDMGANHPVEGEMVLVTSAREVPVDFNMEVITRGFEGLREATNDIGEAFRGIGTSIAGLAGIGSPLTELFRREHQRQVEVLMENQEFVNLVMRNLRDLTNDYLPDPDASPRDRCFLAALELTMKMHGV